VFAAEALRARDSASFALGGGAHGKCGASAAVRRPEEKILVVVLTGDRSLAGAFNSNVIRHASEFMREHSSKQIELVVWVKRARHFPEEGLKLPANIWMCLQRWNFRKPRKLRRV